MASLNDCSNTFAATDNTVQLRMFRDSIGNFNNIFSFSFSAFAFIFRSEQCYINCGISIQHFDYPYILIPFFVARRLLLLLFLYCIIHLICLLRLAAATN